MVGMFFLIIIKNLQTRSNYYLILQCTIGSIYQEMFNQKENDDDHNANKNTTPQNRWRKTVDVQLKLSVVV